MSLAIVAAFFRLVEWARNRLGDAHFLSHERERCAFAS
jgi:hypothetical protein